MTFDRPIVSVPFDTWMCEPTPAGIAAVEPQQGNFCSRVRSRVGTIADFILLRMVRQQLDDGISVGGGVSVSDSKPGRFL